MEESSSSRAKMGIQGKLGFVVWSYRKGLMCLDKGSTLRLRETRLDSYLKSVTGDAMLAPLERLA